MLYHESKEDYLFTNVHISYELYATSCDVIMMVALRIKVGLDITGIRKTNRCSQTSQDSLVNRELLLRGNIQRNNQEYGKYRTKDCTLTV